MSATNRFFSNLHNGFGNNKRSSNSFKARQSSGASQLHFLHFLLVHHLHVLRQTLNRRFPLPVHQLQLQFWRKEKKIFEFLEFFLKICAKNPLNGSGVTKHIPHQLVAPVGRPVTHHRSLNGVHASPNVCAQFFRILPRFPFRLEFGAPTRLQRHYLRHVGPFDGAEGLVVAEIVGIHFFAILCEKFDVFVTRG